ncbi:glycosyltransferase [Candidatus Gottesmanbacteria bacterium]|nr:glycosyltransferase [Candidatus Gottesmanbacteria bacterium]
MGLECVTSWKGATETIVINDGSSDASGIVLKRFSSSIRLITHKTNKGKGHAMAKGIQKSQGDILMFLDGDIKGLTYADLDALIQPIIRFETDMTLGIVRFHRLKRFSIASSITGQRAVWKKNITPHLQRLASSGFGAEIVLNDIHKQLRVVTVQLSTVTIVDKFKKHPLHMAIISYIREWFEVASEWLSVWKVYT